MEEYLGGSRVVQAMICMKESTTRNEDWKSTESGENRTELVNRTEQNARNTSRYF